MRISPLELSWEVEIWYVDTFSRGLGSVCWEGGISTFQPHFIPSQPQRSSFLVRFSHFSLFEFVPRIIPIQIELGT